MLPGVEAKHRELMTETRVFHREVEAHFHLLPLLNRFLKEETRSFARQESNRVSPTRSPLTSTRRSMSMRQNSCVGSCADVSDGDLIDLISPRSSTAATTTPTGTASSCSWT